MGRSSPNTWRWAARRGVLGFPTTDEKGTPDGVGRYNQFAGTGGASIYWTPKTGAHEVQGAIRAHWSQLSWERGILGYPITDERATRTPGGRYNNFQGGSMTWYPTAGTHEVNGAIKTRWQALGADAGRLGFPTTDEYSVAGRPAQQLPARHHHLDGGHQQP